jgi:signal transduction histidine kinase/integral membrane sensor domain MASE1/CheY-like chemotaxis protein
VSPQPWHNQRRVATLEAPSSVRSRPRPFATSLRELALYVAFGAAYVAVAKLGFRAAFVAEQVSPVWPATGLALWGILRFGTRIWPAIWLGSVVANATTHVPIVPACLMATGNMIEAFAGAWFLRRFGGVERSLDRLRDVVALIVGAAILSTAISATVGVVTLCGWGLQPWRRFGALWSTWWLGGATGALLVAPLLLTLSSWRRTLRQPAAAGEAAVLAALAVALSILVFATWPADVAGRHPLEYLPFPLVMWAGFRFAHPGAALVSIAVSSIAVSGTLNGTGPFGEPGSSLHESITLLQIYSAVMATSGLVFGAAIADRNRAERLRETDHLLTAILSQEQDLKTAGGRILQTVSERLEWDVGILWRADDKTDTLEYVQSSQASGITDGFVSDSRAQRFQRGVGLPGRVWATGQPAWIYDVVVDPNFPRAPAAKRQGLHGAFAFPISPGAKVLGVMEFFSREPRRPDPSLLTLMTAAGLQIGHFIERVKAQQDRAELLERERTARLQAESASRAKDQFLATVSHELRTPLTAILGWASMLQRGEVDAGRVSQIHEKIFKNAEAQARIVNDLLDVSRIVSGQLGLEWQRTDICEVARQSVETIRPTAIAKGVVLESKIASGGCFVSGDPARLQQVIWNLLFNAIKFTPAGGTVSLVARPANGNAIVEVSDTGIGIPAEFLPRLFERFWQADSTSTRVHGGLGLGLALVRHLIEIHGGDVEARSAGEGRGSTFVVSLPLRAELSAGFGAGSAERMTDNEDLESLRVLVVDDDPGALELFSTALEKSGAAVVCAKSAREAMQRLELHPVDALVIDIGLPSEDGFMLLRRIREWEAALSRSPVPAIAVTAYATTIDRDEALQAGFAAHLAKPVLPHQFVAAVRQMTTERSA